MGREAQGRLKGNPVTYKVRAILRTTSDVPASAKSLAVTRIEQGVKTFTVEADSLEQAEAIILSRTVVTLGIMDGQRVRQ